MLTYADVGERLVASAAARGLRVTIARLGMIVGDARTGCCNAKDVYCRMLIGFAQTQAFPRLAEGARMVRGPPLSTMLTYLSLMLYVC
jgi:thioester reductase-like protein